jgi:hypothetical protein
MSSATQSIVCPECAAPATLAMYTETATGGTERFRFELACPNGHQVSEELARTMWMHARN